MDQHSNQKCCSADISQMEAEHRQLNEAVTNLQPIILYETEETRVAQATAALYELMEHYLAAEDEGPVPLYEHSHMMGILTHLRALPYGHRDLRQQVFMEFMHELHRKDARAH